MALVGERRWMEPSLVRPAQWAVMHSGKTHVWVGRRSAALSKCALGPLPAGYPSPLARLSLCDISVCVTLSSSPPTPRAELLLHLHRLCVQVRAHALG